MSPLLHDGLGNSLCYVAWIERWYRLVCMGWG